MTILLKQSTATTIVLGPFLDDTDGVTPETGLTIAQSDVLLWKQGGTGFSAKNDSTAATHRSNGMYTVPLDTTDTATLGQLVVSVSDGGAAAACPVWEKYQVVPANVWDSLFGSDKLQVDAVELNSVAASAQKLERAASTILLGTVDGTGTNSTTQIEAADVTEATADHYKGLVLKFTSGAMAGQGTAITAYSFTGGRGRFTVAALTEAPAGGVTFEVQ
jgi:hypothetical protein